MRTFPNFPGTQLCPICNSNRNGECWLMAIDGTEDGGNVQAAPVHVECTGRYMIGKMRLNREAEIVYAFID